MKIDSKEYNIYTFNWCNDIKKDTIIFRNIFCYANFSHITDQEIKKLITVINNNKFNMILIGRNRIMSYIDTVDNNIYYCVMDKTRNRIWNWVMEIDFFDYYMRRYNPLA